MGRWPGKYVIGVTGNIAAGKSVVRKMLEHLGAYGIDADVLAHRAILKGAPAYAKVVRAFGEFMLGPDGEIDRARLAQLVFSDAPAMARLEAVVHPLVRQAVDVLIGQSRRPVAVVEAIKLIESSLAKECDAVWVVDAPEPARRERLIRKRGLTDTDARQRLAAQAPQEDKVRAADVVIHNAASFDQTWAEVLAAWRRLAAAPAAEAFEAAPAATGQMLVRRGKPSDAAKIAAFLQRAGGSARPLSRDEVMEAFGDKAYMLAEVDGQMVGLAGWKVENLVSRTDELVIAPVRDFAGVTPKLLEAVEDASRELQSEVALVFVPADPAEHRDVWSGLGYRPQTVEDLGVRAWQEAAHESRPPGSHMMMKRLREDRVMRPI